MCPSFAAICNKKLCQISRKSVPNIAQSYTVSQNLQKLRNLDFIRPLFL